MINLSQMEWKQVTIWKDIVKETTKSILIKCPDNCNYSKHMFWYPKKLINNISNSKEIIYITYFDDMMLSIMNSNTKEKFEIKAKDFFSAVEVNRFKK